MNKHETKKHLMATLKAQGKYLLSLLLISILLSGCAGSNLIEKTNSFVYAISATQNINPNIKNHPSSVVVRIYQLNNNVNFETARYDDLFNPAKNVLGAEFIAVNEYLVDPGMNTEVNIDVLATTKFFGVAVGFRSIDTVNWRTTVKLNEKSSLNPIALFGASGIRIIVDGLNVRAEEL